LSDRPLLSVVIAATDSAQAVARCVASLGAPMADGRVEVIVTAARDRINPQRSGHGFTWLAVEPGMGLAELRRLGLERSTAEIVAFIEDSCVVSPGWAEAWVSTFSRPWLLAATGPVEHGTPASVLDWAVFFCEYAPFLLPHRNETTTRLAGNNFAIRGNALWESADSNGIHESLVVLDLTRSGRVPVFVSEALVWHTRHFTLREAVRDRLRFGLDYGRLQACEGHDARRLLAIALGPLILLAQAGRLVSTLVAKRRHWGQFVETLPITLALLTAWSVGEWLGRLHGLLPTAGCRRRGKAARTALPTPGRAVSRPVDCRPVQVHV